MDQYDTLLLTAVHHQDLRSIRNCLSSMANPNVYLNRVYDQPKKQKCTLLMIACLYGYDDILSMIFKRFKPDLEVLNTIQIRNRDKKLEIHKHVTLIWAAAAINHFPIVQLFTDYGANIDHRTSTNSTAIRCACYSGNVDMVRYLVENGADAHINNNNNGTNVTLAVYHKCFDVLVYLVDGLGCDVNECDDDGRSPLYFAVQSKSLKIVEFLLKSGARNVCQTSDRLSPLMLAAETRCCEIVDAMSSYCSIMEWIEAEELLGSAFACAEYGSCDLQQSYEYYYRAMRLRLTHNIPKIIMDPTKEAFNHRKECSTIDELEELRRDSEKMYIEALLVRERLLGPKNPKYRHTLIHRGAVLANELHFEETVLLWLYELALRQQYSLDIKYKRLRDFTSVFCEMINRCLSLSTEALLTVTRLTVEQIKRNKDKIDFNLHTLLFLTTLISQSSTNVSMSPDDRKVFHRLLYSINQTSYSTHEQKSSLLHLSLNNRTLAADNLIDRICKYPCLSTVHTLLECGSDVNICDIEGNTPLHILASNANVSDENIFEILCDAGAHIDYANTRRQTPIDLVKSRSIKQLLQERIKLSLKCLCARLIQNNRIPFHRKIPASLVNFVERH